MKVYWIEVMKYIEGHNYKKPSEETKMLSRKLGLGDWWEVLRKVWAAVWFPSWRHQPRKLPPACCQLLLLALAVLASSWTSSSFSSSPPSSSSSSSSSSSQYPPRPLTSSPTFRHLRDPEKFNTRRQHCQFTIAKAICEEVSTDTAKSTTT